MDLHKHFLDKRELLLTGIAGLQELLIQRGGTPDTWGERSSASAVLPTAGAIVCSAATI
jgi:hypothetical protein